MKEVYRDIKGCEGLYKISNLGRVKSLKFGKERILKPCKDSRGYLYVDLSIDGIYKNNKIHRLVCETFLSNPNNKRTVNHKNGIKTDNRLDNLEWTTHSENNKHAYDIGLKTCKFGKYHHNSKPILQYDKQGNFISEYYGASEAERQTGINAGDIRKCCKGNKNYTHAGGYIWKYKNEKL